MTKDEAKKQVIHRWRSLPVMERRTHKQANSFVPELGRTISFHTMGSCERVMLAWLVNDLEELEAIQETLIERDKAA
ncbi:MAG: hypothetical protein ABI216_01820 [Devosia sp.]